MDLRGVQSFNIIVLNANMMHLVDLLDGAVQTRWSLSDENWLGSRSPRFDDRTFVK